MKTDYRDWLEQELIERQNKNTNYSLRAFARDLNISRSALSSALSRQSDLSRKNLELAIKNLHLSPKQSHNLLYSAGYIKSPIKPNKTLMLEESQFQCISTWYIWGLLSLARLPNCKSDPKWIAKRFGITVSQARHALETLKRLKLIELKGKTRIVRTSSTSIDTGDFHGWQSLRKSKLEDLDKAKEFLQKNPEELKSHISLTIPADPKLLVKARKMNRAFIKKMERFFEAGKKKEVYTLLIALYPLTRQE